MRTIGTETAARFVTCGRGATGTRFGGGLAVAALVLVFCGSANAATLWSESSNGDLAGSTGFAGTTVIGTGLGGGSYEVLGSISTSFGDRYDVFGFGLAPGHVLQNGRLLSYSSSFADDTFLGAHRGSTSYSHQGSPPARGNMGATFIGNVSSSVVNPGEDFLPGGPGFSSVVPGTTSPGTDTAFAFELYENESGNRNYTLQFNVGAPELTGGPDRNFGNVRLGTSSGPSNVTMTNTGASQTTLINGSFSSADGDFSGGPQSGVSLVSGAAADVSYTFTPTSLGAKNTSVSLNSSNAGSDTVQLTGVGVGPQFSSSILPGGIINFGLVTDSELLALTLENIAPVDLGDVLTGLTITGFGISGPDAANFDLPGFAPFVVSAGDTFNLPIEFTNFGMLGLKNATLSLFTDEGASFGESGSQFQYSLQVEAVPEPSTFVSLAGFGLMGLVCFRRRKCRK